MDTPKRKNYWIEKMDEASAKFDEACRTKNFVEMRRWRAELDTLYRLLALVGEVPGVGS